MNWSTISSGSYVRSYILLCHFVHFGRYHFPSSLSFSWCVAGPLEVWSGRMEAVRRGGGKEKGLADGLAPGVAFGCCSGGSDREGGCWQAVGADDVERRRKVADLVRVEGEA